MDYAQRQRNPRRHLAGISLVIILHVLLGYAVVNGLGRKIVEKVKAEIQAKNVEEKKVEKEPDTPPPPPPKFAPPPPDFIPPPDIVIATPTVSTTAITQVVREKPTAPPAPVVAAPKIVTHASWDRGSCSTPEPNYPMASRRNQETGTVQLRYTVDAAGALVKVDVIKSSGHTRLDEAAKAWIATCHFRAGQADGKSVGDSMVQAYTFNLRD